MKHVESVMEAEEKPNEKEKRSIRALFGKYDSIKTNVEMGRERNVMRNPFFAPEMHAKSGRKNG